MTLAYEATSASAADTLRYILEADVEAHEESQASFLDWSMKVPEPRGPLNFAAWPFQKELYTRGFDDQELVVCKATQLGVSAWLVRWGLAWADQRGARVLYIFPRERQLLDFSDSRVRPLILSEYLRTRVPPASVQNKALKQVGPGLIFFRGSEAEAGLESIDADCLCFDEHDLLVPSHIPIAERRIGASSLGLIRRIGFPTISEYGIHAEFLKTDMREWFVRCDACGLRQPITWAENVDVELGIRVCSACRKGPIDVAVGEWVAKHPERTTKGYHVTKLIVPRQEIMPRLIAASKETLPYKRQVFFNRDLGEPHEAEGARLTPALIAACQRQELRQEGGYGGQNLVVMGVDVASTRNLNVWISERYEDGTGRCLWVGEVDSFDALSRMMDVYRVSMAGIDHLPEGRLARAFAERHAGRVTVINYATAGQQDVLKVDVVQRRSSVRRTEALDAAFDRIRGQRDHLPMDLPEGFVAQMCANVRSVEQDDLGRMTVVYRATEADDYAQAAAYAAVANETFWVQQQVAHSTEITSIDELEELAFQRSTLGDYDADDEYSPGRDDGGYSLDATNGLGEY